MFLKKMLQKAAVNFTSGAPEPYYRNVSENVFSHIVLKKVTSAFDEADYNKKVNVTHVFIYCFGVVLAAYRAYNSENRGDDRSKKILHAINHFSFNNIYQMVLDNFRFTTLKDASSYFMNLSDHTYSYAIESNNTAGAVNLFLEHVLIDKSDAYNHKLIQALVEATDEAFADSLHYFNTGRLEPYPRAVKLPETEIVYTDNNTIEAAPESKPMQASDVTYLLDFDEFDNYINNFASDKYEFFVDSESIYNVNFAEAVIFSYAIPLFKYCEFKNYRSEAVVVLKNRVVTLLEEFDEELAPHLKDKLAFYGPAFRDCVRTNDYSVLAATSVDVIFGFSQDSYCHRKIKEFIEESL